MWISNNFSPPTSTKGVAPPDFNVATFTPAARFIAFVTSYANDSPPGVSFGPPTNAVTSFVSHGKNFPTAK